jgi:5'-methylthioadenosine phosphorylase
MTSPIRIGVIGGSGVYHIEHLTDIEEVRVETPFGEPSDAYIVGTIEGQRVAFLPRHGRGHRISPSRLNYRANIFGFKLLGVEYLIGVSACGSLQERIAPGHIVVPDQLFDRTHGRAGSFFDDPSVGTDGLVTHVSVADPFCPYLSEICLKAVLETGNPAHFGGNFVTVEGPRFSTKAESRVFRSWGMDIIGMTTTPEAQLAREAEMSYAVMAHVTDYDVWHESETPVTVEMVIQTLLRNASVAKQAVVNAIRLLADAPASPHASAMRDALISNKSTVRADVVERLRPIVGKYFTA